MILGVFPSYKDKEMVDLLYQFERDTRLSLNILVENFLEQLLYEKGYLTVNLDEESIDEANNETNETVSETKISISDEFSSDEKEDLSSMKFIHFSKKRKVYIIKKWMDGRAYNFGTYKDVNEAKEVRAFLVIKNWDIKYSTKESGLKGRKYTEWISSEIEKEKQLQTGDESNGAI